MLQLHKSGCPRREPASPQFDVVERSPLIFLGFASKALSRRSPIELSPSIAHCSGQAAYYYVDPPFDSSRKLIILQPGPVSYHRHSISFTYAHRPNAQANHCPQYAQFLTASKLRRWPTLQSPSLPYLDFDGLVPGQSGPRSTHLLHRHAACHLP